MWKGVKKMEDKKEFIRELGELLNKYNIEDVSRLEYIKDGQGEEVEIVIFDPLFKKEFKERVSINKSSLVEILRIVSRRISG